MTKLQRIVALLEGWLDYFPYPEVWTGSLERRSAIPGPAPSRQVVCDRCEGKGKLPGNWPCDTCQGRGRLSIDAYTGQPVATAETTMTQLLDTWTACSTCAGGDRQCSRCNGTGREPALMSGKVRADLNGSTRRREGDSLLDALAEGLQRRQATVSGRKVEAGMRELRDLDPFAHSLIVWVLVLGGERPSTLHPWSRVRLLEGLLALERLVPGNVVLPPELAHAWRVRAAVGAAAAGRRLERRKRDQRDHDIREAYASGGWSQEALGRKFGVDQATVSRVVNGRTREAA